MDDLSDLDILRESLSRKSGICPENLQDCEKMSVFIFQDSNIYVSRTTLARLYRLSPCLLSFSGDINVELIHCYLRYEGKLPQNS